MSATARKPKKHKKPGKPKKFAAPAPDVVALTKRLQEQHKLGEEIRRKDATRAKQETKCAEIQANLKSEREVLHELERELEGMKDDLTNLAVGGFAERLPFDNKPATVDAKPADAAPAATKVDADAWKAVTLADVWKEVGANVKLLDLLENGTVKRGPKKGQAAGIRTLGDLVAFQSHPQAKLTDIGGVGPEKEEAIGDATEKWWAKRPQTAAAPAPDTSSLAWQDMSENQAFAETASGVKRADGGEGSPTPQFVVSKTADGWSVD